MWWSKHEKDVESLLEEHVKRLWDMKARLEALEDRFESQLTELRTRYQRAEQSERDRMKRAKKVEQTELEDQIIEETRHPAILELLKRRGANAPDPVDISQG